MSEYRYLPGFTGTFGIDYTSRLTSPLHVGGHNDRHEAVLVEADKWNRKFGPYRTPDPTSLEEMEKNTAHLTKFGRQAHQSKPARYVMCKAEKELRLSKVPPGYCEGWGHEDDSVI